MLDSAPSTVDRVIAAVKDRIRDAQYAPGQRLVEPTLMAELGVSRGSVREALRRLAAEGFVEWERFRGARARSADVGARHSLLQAGSST